MTKTEAYAILGISSRDNAKSAMRRLVKIHHPDKGGDAKLFERIMDAYRLTTNQTFKIDRLSFGHPDIRESVFSRRFVRCLEDHGALVYVMTGSAYMKIGMPDLYFCHSWLQGWVELKVENGKLADAQRRQLQKLRERGVFAIVARNRVQHGVIFETDAPVHLLKKMTKDSLLSAMIVTAVQVKSATARS